MSDTSAYPGWKSTFDDANDFNAISFLIRQAMARASHVALVQVMAVHTSQPAGSPPTVDVQPMVAMIDQTGVALEHGTIHGLPTFRTQSGSYAFVCDPQVNDIGVAIFADRDISSAVKNQAPSNPGSFRRFDWADGLYIGGFARVAPTDYVRIDGNGIEITTPNTVTVTAPHVIVNSNDVNLGASGGAAVARVGDSVAGGVITTGSGRVKSA